MRFEEVVADTLFWVKNLTNHELVVLTGVLEFEDEWGLFFEVSIIVIIVFNFFVSVLELTNVDTGGIDIRGNVVRELGQVIIQIFGFLELLPEIFVFLLECILFSLLLSFKVGLLLLFLGEFNLKVSLLGILRFDLKFKKGISETLPKCTYILGIFFGLPVVKKPFGEEFDWVMWFSLVCFGESLGDNATDVVLLQVGDIRVLRSHDLTANFVTHFFKFEFIFN